MSVDAKPATAAGVRAFARELPVLLLVSLVLAFLLRTFVVQVFYIPSASMEPTLQVDDRIVVEKITYRFRQPRHGEVVVFHDGEASAGDPELGRAADLARVAGRFLGIVPANAKDLVKRVIGLPGDEVTIDRGVVSVNGVPFEEPYVVFEDQRSHGPFRVPAGALFVLGDNRPNSADSRFGDGLGYVEASRIVGRAALVVWPPSNVGSLSSEAEAAHGS